MERYQIQLNIYVCKKEIFEKTYTTAPPLKECFEVILESEKGREIICEWLTNQYFYDMEEADEEQQKEMFAALWQEVCKEAKE